MTASDPKPRLGYLGMGAMGAPMAARLLASGYPVTAWSRDRAKAEPLGEKGAILADSPAAIAASVDILLSCVTDDAAVTDLYLSPTGVLPAIPPTTIIIDMSTILPATSRALAAAAKSRGVVTLDAPVSGSVTHAGSGQLVIFVGGPVETYQKCAPIFSTLARAHFHMGDHGAGAAMKLLVNAMLGTGMETLAEAISFGQAAGLDRAALLTALAETTVVSPSQKAKLENIKAERYPTTFALRLMAKDFSLIQQLAAANRVPIPAIAAAAAISTAALKTQDPNEDYSATIRFVEKLAGLKK